MTRLLNLGCGQHLRSHFLIPAMLTMEEQAMTAKAGEKSHKATATAANKQQFKPTKMTGTGKK